MPILNKLALIVGVTIIPLGALAQSIGEIQSMQPDDRRAYMQSMSVDERTAMREKWRSEYDSLSDEQKRDIRKKRHQQHHERRAAARERWQNMSDDERAMAKEKRQERRAQRRQRWESMSDEERSAAGKHRADRKRRHWHQHRHRAAD